MLDGAETLSRIIVSIWAATTPALKFFFAVRPGPSIASSSIL